MAGHLNSKAWAWWDTKRAKFLFVYPTEAAVRLCSNDGFKKAEAAGEGTVISVVVEAAVFEEKALWITCKKHGLHAPALSEQAFCKACLKEVINVIREVREEAEKDLQPETERKETD